MAPDNWYYVIAGLMVLVFVSFIHGRGQYWRGVATTLESERLSVHSRNYFTEAKFWRRLYMSDVTGKDMLGLTDDGLDTLMQSIDEIINDDDDDDDDFGMSPKG